MAKGDKSESIPGGSKAADFGPGGKTNGGHTADHGTPAEAKHAPVTTDAAAHTPTHPGEPGEPVAAARSAVPVRDEVKTAATVADAKSSSWVAPDGSPADGPTKPKGKTAPKGMGRFAADADEAPDLTVKDFVGMVREFTAAVKARNWFQAFQLAGAITSAFAVLMNSGALVQVTQEDAAALSEADGLTAELAQCRAECGASLGGRASVSFDGGNEPHPLSGSPMPLAAAQAGADVKGFDPSLILVAFEMVMKIVAALRNR